jgi:hypothetical protein
MIFVILQILSSMLEINVYSIKNSNMFGVTIDDHFIFAIGIEKVYNCK